jgi:hypothetical protein
MFKISEFSQLSQVSIADWIEVNGYLMAAGLPRREVYLMHGDDGRVSDVQIPAVQKNRSFA